MGKISEDYGKLNVAMFVGLDYDDELWDVLLDQITLDEMTELVRMGGYATVPIPSINLPGTINRDGPAGISDRLAGGRISAMAFPVQTVLASTWNVDLVEEMGRLVGEDSIHSDVAGWYAPGVNLHRLPFGGRNFEYFSEDNFLSGQMGASIVAGAQSKGAFTTVKHFALNEQDTNRIGGAIFANEQSIRELYLKPFEITVREANVSAAMASLNRIGARWSGAHEGLMTETLRNEWGFEGLVVTDQASFSVFEYQDIIAGQEAGTNLWLNTDSSLWTFDEEDLTPTVVNNIRKSTKDILYTIVNSHAMNGMSSSSQVVPVTPLWKYWLLGANILVGLLAFLVFYL
ncbi:glycoside hydrolase family 3 N-terminal domain-containing protein [Bacillus sp. JCM 19034]|uniref:glycoside hydrolase family 3 N-terminal domain-containing protein n=1 Tax=Bacillus sp. JCM 19034 TaxID=1481928 RepID=UPI0018D0BDD3|nr:glycoside hydrolase family 3 N-terminal domain-containing protein [Bacillus sp. JCM 19034]